MAKLSADEEATLRALSEKASAPDDVDVWMRDPDSGREIKVTGDYARRVLKQFGLIDEEPAAGTENGGDPAADSGAGGGTGKPGEPEPKSQHGYFR